MTSAILAIDQGTTNSKAVLVSRRARSSRAARRRSASAIRSPAGSSKVRERIWDSVLEAIAAAVGRPAVEIVGIAISNQRESVTVWDAATGEPLGPVVSWQCRRTAALARP